MEAREGSAERDVVIAFADVEASSLEERSGHLLEVGIAVTDDDLNELWSTEIAIQPVGTWIDNCPMDPVVREMHEKNGLLAHLRAGGGVRRFEAEEILIKALTTEGPLAGEVEIDSCVNCKKRFADHILEDYCPQASSLDSVVRWSGKCVPVISQTPLAGFSIGFDDRWLREHMPRLQALFSRYRIDVSSFVQMAKRWAPAVYGARPKNKEAAHRALADARESIAYMRYFRDCGFVGGGAVVQEVAVG